MAVHSDPIHRGVLRQIVAMDIPSETTVVKLRSAQRHWADRLLTHAVSVGADPALINEIALTLSSCFDRMVDAQAAFLAEAQRGRADGGGPRRRWLAALPDPVERSPNPPR